MSVTYENGIIKAPEVQFDENCGGIGNVLFKSLKKYGDRLAVINASTDEYETYSSYLKKIIRTALKLKKQGFQQQNTLAICSNKQNIQAHIPVVAGQFLGLITFTIDPSLSVEEISELLQQVQPKIIFVIASVRDKIKSSLERVNSKPLIVTFGEEFEEDYLNIHDKEQSFEPIFLSDLNETCMIHFSSGTTGLPKPICLSHYYFLAVKHTMMAYNVSERRLFNGLVGTVSLRYASLYWISASFELFHFTVTGGCRILRDKFDAEETWRLIDKYSVTTLHLTPLQCYELSLMARPKDVKASNLKEIVRGGYALHKDYIPDLRLLFPDTCVRQVYGMTECGLVACFNSNIPRHLELLNERPLSCGLPVPGFQYKVIDLYTGKKCGPNQPGELYVKARSVFRRFYNRDASESFDNEGYFRSGDLVTFDEDFCFHIKDRIKSLLTWNDWRIIPHYIEKVLLTHSAVYDAVVIGVPHKIQGERLLGVVKLKANAPKVTEDELVKYVDARVEDHKRLREGIRFLDHFPMTVSGKVSRMKVKEKILKDLYRSL